MSEITAEYFKACTGYGPIDDDLERCNCDKAGQIGHELCGWDKNRNMPNFLVGFSLIKERKGGVMSEHIDHKQALTNLIPNGAGYNSDYAATLAGAVEYIEQVEQQCADLAEALQNVIREFDSADDYKVAFNNARAALAKYHESHSDEG